jgi:ketosteroid isomerase-like protein
MAEDAESVIREAYGAFNRRDPEAAVALMAPDVEWPDAAAGGFVHGRDAVGAHWREQFESVDPRVEPLDFREDPDGRIAVTVRQAITPDGGESSEQRLVHLYTIRDGLIERMEITDEATTDDE